MTTIPSEIELAGTPEELVEAYPRQCPGCKRALKTRESVGRGLLFTLDDVETYAIVLCPSCLTKIGNVPLEHRIETRLRKDPKRYALPLFMKNGVRTDVAGYRPPNDGSASDNDRVWFAQNPGRTHRLRFALPDEKSPPGTCVIVRQLAPGMRRRLPLALEIHSAGMKALADDDDALALAFTELERTGAFRTSKAPEGPLYITPCSAEEADAEFAARKGDGK